MMGITAAEQMRNVEAMLRATDARETWADWLPDNASLPPLMSHKELIEAEMMREDDGL